ncbi:phosphomevalonate kinase [Brachybacterium hainanense]|uniref:phosphomevalonate kinase n=1 Tax=Brachybacterium hainanense TaxID=1541174 RepID=A0ABV6R769_9MICO
MIEKRAPGKLYIAGEYAVVEPGQPAVLVAVDRFISVRLEELAASAEAGRVHSSAYGKLPVVWTRDAEDAGIVLEHTPYDYVISALATLEELRRTRGLAPRYYDLHISTELDDTSGRKFGLGSSAAVVVATIAAIDEFYGLGLTRTERFQLALLATVQVSPRASGGDLAASTFGGWIRYTAPDRAALRAHLRAHGVEATLARGPWEQFSIAHLREPKALSLLVGWTGSPASTERLVDGVTRSDGVQHAREDQDAPADEPADYPAFLAASRDCLDALVAALASEQPEQVLVLVRRARRLLQRLGAISGILIETQKLRALCDIAESAGAAGKPSGAGGGDCGIVLVPREGGGLVEAGIESAWREQGIRLLDLAVHPAEGEADGR